MPDKIYTIDRELAEKIVDDIIKDLTNRRGLMQEWEAIDLPTQDEIYETWIEIVQEASTRGIPEIPKCRWCGVPTSGGRCTAFGTGCGKSQIWGQPNG